jgi:heme/copper-type cytochrome/quinol oxidase subunit 4
MSPIITEVTEVKEGVAEGVVVAVVVVALAVVALVIGFVCFLVMKEKQGKPVFKNLEDVTAPKDVELRTADNKA